MRKNSDVVMYRIPTSLWFVVTNHRLTDFIIGGDHSSGLTSVVRVAFIGFTFCRVQLERVALVDRTGHVELPFDRFELLTALGR